MITKYKNIAIFLIISLCLLIPFGLLKGLSSDYEIFPAALFPGGADRISVKDTIALNSLELYGIDQKTGDTAKIDILHLFKRTIHIHHMVYFFKDTYFGALNYEGQPPAENNPYSRFATEADKEQTREWVRKGLREQHCRDSVLLVRFTEIKLDADTRKLISDTITNEKVLRLY